MHSRNQLLDKLRWVGLASLLSACAVACVVEEHHHDYGPPSSSGGAGTPGGGATSGSDPGPSGTVKPVLVDVDTGRTMSAQPGDGVGVFVEYQAGGHWHVWWTCDTNKTNQTCEMDVKVTVASGQLSNVKGDAAGATGSATPLSASSTSIESATTTSTGIDGMTFDTAAGGIITLEASIGALRDGSFIFFVQNGKINGGYTGKLTDPLQLEGSAP